MKALVLGLPPGGVLHRRLDPRGWAWTYTEELLATVAELVDYGNRMFFSAHSKKKPAKPLEVRRPWQKVEEVKRRKPSAAEVIEFFRRKD